MSSRRQARGEYIETDSGNKVSRKANLQGTQNIMLGGKAVIQPEVMIRGDLVRTAPSTSSSSSSSGGGGSGGAAAGAAGAAAAAGGGGGGGSAAPKAPTAPANTTAVAIGRYCFLAKGALLRPPGRMYRGSFTYMPLRMGDHVFVGQGSVVQAATVGSHVHIGRGCTVGQFAIIKDCVRILDGTVIPPNMVIPSFSIVGGQPARLLGELPEGGGQEDFELRDLYKTVGNNPQPPAP
ncbi:dynactin 5 [Geosmithia morbida]|uniref:Dynactin subunit 5 n=1 Tax=Geosmithia morbida TaxID=1094350 RepID=A0A9P4YQM3_9HYPO|nr:dynactin 5 [Geosmithia morbida]KAF4119994.1 dynactin 5 [Geosmithia morbida]